MTTWRGLHTTFLFIPWVVLNSKSTKKPSLVIVSFRWISTLAQNKLNQTAIQVNHKIERKSISFFYEPENDGENRIQEPLLKKMADGHLKTLTTKGLYMVANWFHVEGNCHDKSTFIGCDRESEEE